MDAEDPRIEEEAAPSRHLSQEEVETVAGMKAGSARVVHEAIRLQGNDELSRPLASLLFSAFAAGLAISVSVLAESFLSMRLPATPAFELVSSFGYSIGFVIVILGNLQLFTENTVTAVLPLASHPTARNFGRLLRLWAIVFAGNMLGTLFVAVLMAHDVILSPEQREAALALASKLLAHDAGTTLLLGVPSGFLVGAIAWILPSARSSEFWIVTAITYVIAIGGFSHVVAGSAEAWLLWLSGRASLGWAVFGFILPALVGNIIGGTGLFAVLAHGQVRGEL
ncbi:formate/nitrite transporter family protein [Sphingomonas nostoxanthinifaciens]|uniref:formate/nitrite transporter family protein n=1 Tax=Sphingomonas nostoxanthinifaciens TaxID=2872652 RepID=UPI001CC1E254|nr:formate/nitrite transporter family protein [Sphingomonas nostoxanthinifaciens]UAK25161.1 formate/nitrite transporter family protein [Sphingomonas nostoxanthinifaciens]